MIEKYSRFPKTVQIRDGTISLAGGNAILESESDESPYMTQHVLPEIIIPALKPQTNSHRSRPVQ